MFLRLIKIPLAFIFILTPLLAHPQSKPEDFTGDWICKNTALNQPQKNITRTITKTAENEFQSYLKGLYTTSTQVFVLKEDLLIQKDAVDYGLMIQAGKLQTVEIKNGKPSVPKLGQIVCEKIKGL